MRPRTAGAVGYALGLYGPRRTLRTLRRLAVVWVTLLLVLYGWWTTLPLLVRAVVVLGVLAGLGYGLRARTTSRPVPLVREPIPYALRQTVIARDGYLCHICNLPVAPDDVHIDHVHPVALGGTNDLGNLAVAHSICNLRKGARPWQPPYGRIA